jgi:DnaK suppressor protein
VPVDTARAKELIRADRQRTNELLAEMTGRIQADREAANQPGDMFDSAEPLTGEGTDESVVAELRGHLAAIDRAEQRLEAGTYGYSVKSGVAIPDDRLEADPSAELTVEEAEQAGGTVL